MWSKILSVSLIVTAFIGFIIGMFDYFDFKPWKSEEEPSELTYQKTVDNNIEHLPDNDEEINIDDHVMKALKEMNQPDDKEFTDKEQTPKIAKEMKSSDNEGTPVIKIDEQVMKALKEMNPSDDEQHDEKSAATDIDDQLIETVKDMNN